jgi:hypothetical protein
VIPDQLDTIRDHHNRTVPYLPDEQAANDWMREADHDRGQLLNEIDRQRKLLGQFASFYLDRLMAERFEDGTPVLETALQENPELRDRLLAAFGVERHDA